MTHADPVTGAEPLDDDPYLWLEDVTGDEQLAWVRARNEASLGDLTTGERFAELRDGFLEVLDSHDRIPYIRRRGELFYNFWQDAEHPRGLWRRTTLESYRTGDPEWELLLDVDALGAAEGESWVWAGAAVHRPEYVRALVQLSRGGADATVVREFDLRTLEFVPADKDGFTLPEAKSRVSWIDADTIYVGTDTGPGSMTTSGYPRVIRRWRRGTPRAAATVAFEGAETDVSAFAYHDDTEGFERDFVGSSPDFYTSRQYLCRPDGSHQLIDVPEDADIDVHREWLLVRPRTAWTVGSATHPEGSLLAFGFDDYLAGGRDATVLFAPTAGQSLNYYAWTRHYLILVLLADVASRLEVLSPERGWARAPLPGGPELAATEIIGTDPDNSDEYLLDVSGYTQPSALLRGELSGSDDVETLREAPAFFDASGMRTRQFFAVSDDGTRIPYFVVGPDDPQAGPAPTLMTGYGGFEVSNTPSYSGIVGRGWLARGGTHVVANIRGGGEYGPPWHTAALRENRHRAYEDFAAVARDLVTRGITTREQLAVHGGSNGGLLMGVMLTRYPELFGAIVVMVPLLDMRRYHLLLAGASWMAEYGDPDDPDDWAFIREYSPYQNLRPAADVALPPVLVTTSTRDDRVHPGHARKMVARMQEFGHRVEYYENIEGGHGGAADNKQRAFQWALVHEFCWRHVGGA